MGSMKNLDAIVKSKCISDEEYERNKRLIDMHFNGDVALEDLPQSMRDAIWEWEIDEIELSKHYSIESWSEYDC